jgi:hypothetical protein
MKASEASIDDMFVFIGKLLSRASIISGCNVNSDVAKILIEEIVKDFRVRYPLIHIEEIEAIFDNGSRGVYGEFYGINLLTTNKWIRGYLETDEHNKFISSQVKKLVPLLEEKTSLTEIEIDQLMRNGIVTCFNNFKNTGVAMDYGNPKIDWLITKKIITPSKDERDAYKEQARERLNDEVINKKQSIFKHDRREAKSLEQILDQSDNERIRSIAKNICLCDWFENIIDNDLDINKLIS